MNSVFVGRQPIFERNQSVAGYEVMFRTSADQKAAPTIVDAQLATIDVTSHLLNEIGLEKVVGDRTAFINVSYDFLMNRHADMLPKNSVVLEVLEDTPPTADVVDELRRLADQGYTIALDDFVYSEAFDNLIEIADIIKVELPAIDENDLEEEVSRLREFDGDKKLLAEKVETHEKFHQCLELGFDLFQGYFFSKPEIVQGVNLTDNRLTSLRLLKKVQQADVDVADLAEILQTDPMLCLKLLKYVNSSQFQLNRNIDSIRSAIAIAGINKVKCFAQIATMASLSHEKPRAIILDALENAKMCELISSALGRDTNKYFTAGLFMRVDAMLDQPLEEVLADLSLDSEINEAILQARGPMADVVTLVSDYTRGGEARPLLEGLTQEAVQHVYLQSLQWAEQTVAEMEQA